MIPTSDRLLVLSGREVSRRVIAVLALLEGEDPTLGRVRAALRQAFAPGSDADRLAIGAEDRYLAGVLEAAPVHGERGGRRSAAVVALWLGTELLVCSLGEGRAYLCRDVAPVGNQRLPGESSPGGERRMTRVAVHPGDRLALLDSATARRIADGEVQGAAGCPSVDDTVGWLAVQIGPLTSR